MLVVSRRYDRKDIKKEIFTSTSLGYTYNGVNYVNALVSKPSNSSGASIKGLEFNGYVNSLGFIHPILSGFGATANISLLKGHLEIPLLGGNSRSVGYLVGQPKNIINASFFYQKNGVELRAAYNRQAKALRATLDSTYWQDLYWAPRDQLDLSATYTLKNGMAFYVQAANVTHSARTSLTGPKANLLRNTYTVPTTYWAGIRFTPKFH
jgi:TonB-dependent receptor